MKDGARIFAQLCTVDDLLCRAGHYPRSRWWRDDDERFCMHPTASRRVACVGRGGTKTQELVRWGATCTMFGPDVPPGEFHWFVHLSENLQEASKSLMLYESYFHACGFGCTRTGDQVRLNDAPRGVLCRAFRIGAASGFRAFGLGLDEFAKTEGEADPPKDVLASAVAMMVTHPDGPVQIFSSATSKGTHFHELCERGDTEHQVFSTAPSWVASDAITEEATHKLEPDPVAHAREYGALFGDGVVGNWMGASVDLMIDPSPLEPILSDGRYVHAQDPAENLFWGFASGSHEVGPLDPLTQTRGKSVVRIRESGSWKVDREPGAMLARHKRDVLDRYPDGNVVYTDQYAGAFVKQLNRAINIRTEIVPWTGSGDESKLARCKAVRLAGYNGQFKIRNRPELIRQFRSVRSEFSSAGNERIIFPRTASGHLDELSAVILAGSILLSRPAQLAPSRETYFESRDRKIRERDFALYAGSGGNLLGIGDNE